MKKKWAIASSLVIIAVLVTVWWATLREATLEKSPLGTGNLLPYHTPGAIMDSDPLILSPSAALNQDGEEHIVEFRVRMTGERLDNEDQTTAMILMDGPGTLKEPRDANLATIYVVVPWALVERFKTEAGQELRRVLTDRIVRVKGRIRRDRLSVESVDGSSVEHARVRIEVGELTQIGIVSAEQRATPLTTSGPAMPRPQQPITKSAKAEVGKPAPALDAQRWLNAEGLPCLQDLRGQVVLLDFWGKWCNPCVRKLPRVEELQGRYKDRGLIVIGVHTPSESDNLDVFLKEKKIVVPVMVDTGRTAERYGIEAWPTYFLLDKAGNLAWGPAHDPPSEMNIESLLKR